MTTANLCSTPEPLTSQQSPFAGLLVRHLNSAKGNNALRNFPHGGLCARPSSDRDRRSVELGDGKTFEVLPDVVVALVAKNADGHGLPELQTPLVIGPPMNPGKVACLPNV